MDTGTFASMDSEGMFAPLSSGGANGNGGGKGGCLIKLIALIVVLIYIMCIISFFFDGLI